MYQLTVKNWTHHMHMPKRRDMVIKMDHLFHDQRFWAVVGATALMAVLVILAIFANNSGNQAPIITPMYPFMHYGP